MSQLHAQIGSTRSLSELVDQFRPGVPKVVDDIVAQIQDEVPAYAGPRSGERGQLITMAVTAAINRALELIEGNDTSSSQVNDLFRQMGHGEAHDGNTLEPMQAALRIATHHCWMGLRAFAHEHDLTGDLLGELGDAMFGYIEHLAGQVAEGFRWGTRAMERDPALARTRLLDLMLSDRQPSDALLAETRALATVARWAVPDEVVVMSVAFHRSLPTAEWPGDPLLRIEDSRALMVCAADGAADLARAVSTSAPGVRVSLGWPVEPTAAAEAARWTGRALDLVDRGVIPAEPIVDCARHRPQLWMHADPRLRADLAQELFEPLFAETGNSFEILSETLLAWLETRDSAPVIAEKLGVHPQTVRYRWKRINEIFGEVLYDPEFVVMATMLLKSSLPLWRAGYTEDAERYRQTHPKRKKQ